MFFSFLVLRFISDVIVFCSCCYSLFFVSFSFVFVCLLPFVAAVVCLFLIVRGLGLVCVCLKYFNRSPLFSSAFHSVFRLCSGIITLTERSSLRSSSSSSSSSSASLGLVPLPLVLPYEID